MGGGLSKIIPGIYVGGLAAARSQMQLEKHHITHICTVLQNTVEIPNRKQIVFRADDSPSEDLSRFFEDACFFIHEARVAGGAVLIHCACGVSRSVTITLAYLMVVTDFSLAELFKAVQGARHCACPNHGFMQQLLDFERSGRVAMLREKLFSRFGEWPAERRKQDTDALTAAIKAQEHFILHGVYPGEEPLDGLTPSAMHAADPEGKATNPDLPAPVGKLKHTVFTVYSNDKPRSLEDFIASRCPPEDVGAEAEDK
ncbi:hypothetical protein CRM22_007010 [Opisthorchis felineus]|uniref:Uncharacterized protein n=1 Tax=Opisthorchis felineus TaxID=147828 RepID=A0A4S2LPX9_OPIFE|nr:hypothetical protein CRM22_007010 [Opisthorchis felineus]